MRTCAIALAALLLLAHSSARGEEGQPHAPMDEETRLIMRQLYQSIVTLLPLAVDTKVFRAPENRAKIQTALDTFAANGEVLGKHVAGWEATAGSLGRHLARDTGEIQETFAEGRLDRTAFLLRQVTENCVACHSRLPSSQDSPVSDDFVESPTLAALPPRSQATLLLATRRFDDALTTIEGMLSSPDINPVLLLGPLTDYLTVTVRVKGDLARPIPVLEAFAARPDLWQQLRSDVTTWVTTLRAVDPAVLESGDLASARSRIEAAMLADMTSSRAGLAELVVASAILHRYISEQRGDGRDLAEAYYLLGVTEAQVGRNYWVTEADYYLSKAIRLAPREPFARDAYALLEAETRLSYEGTEEELPADERARLAELRALINGD